MPFDQASATAKAQGIRLRLFLCLVGVGLAAAVLIFTIVVQMLRPRGGEVSLQLVGYRQFGKGGRMYVEMRLTNGTEKSIVYFPPKDEARIRFLPVIRKRTSDGWSDPYWQLENMGIVMSGRNLAPHQSVDALNPLPTGLGEHRFGIVCSVPDPPPPRPFARWFQPLLRRLLPNSADQLPVTPQDQTTIWCPTIVSPPIEDLPEGVARDRKSAR